jgi:hypothetical protein
MAKAAWQNQQIKPKKQNENLLQDQIGFVFSRSVIAVHPRNVN